MNVVVYPAQWCGIRPWKNMMKETVIPSDQKKMNYALTVQIWPRKEFFVKEG